MKRHRRIHFRALKNSQRQYATSQSSAPQHPQLSLLLLSFLGSARANYCISSQQPATQQFHSLGSTRALHASSPTSLKYSSTIACIQASIYAGTHRLELQRSRQSQQAKYTYRNYALLSAFPLQTLSHVANKAASASSHLHELNHRT